MRLQRLDIQAFGPFSGAALDLDLEGDVPGLHVVHGGNAAGKSTTLRALEGLLFGIPERTGDAHRHPPDQLRVGARLVSAAGEMLEVVRRKGRRNTLLDADGQPIDEALLSRLLAGVGPERFRTVFALDAERLRRGAQALLAGGGDVGESLFDAAGGGLAIHELLVELEREADALYTPQARKRSLNEALTAYRAARQRQNKAGLGAEAWREQLAEIESWQQRRDALGRQRHEQLAEQSRLQRIRRLAPLLAQRDEAARALAALGDVTDVPEQARVEREAVDGQLVVARRDLSAVEVALTKNAAEAAELGLPAALLALPDGRVDALQDALGRHRSAAADLPKRRAELAATEDDVRDLLRRLGRDPADSDPEALRLDVARQAHIRKLAAERRELEARHEAALENLAEDEARLARLVAEAARAGAPPDATAVAALVPSALPLAQAAQEFEDNGGAFDRLREDAEARRTALQLERTSFASIERMPVPEREAIERFDDERRRLLAEEQRLAERADDLERRRLATARERAADAASGDVPTEAQLGAARAERDRRWNELLSSGSLEGETPGLYRAAVTDADELADRLRREADRVARHAELVGRERGEQDEVRALASAREDLERRRAEHEAAWSAAWEPCGVSPGPPQDMRGWVRRFEELRAAVGRFLEAELDRQQLERNVQDTGRQLAAAVVSAGQTVLDPVTLPALVCQAEEFVRAADEAADEHRRRADEQGALEQRLDETRRPRARRAEQALVEWQRSWAAGVAALALPGDVDPEQAEAVLDVLGELFPKLDGAERLRRRIEGMQRDAQVFAASVEELCAAHLPGAGELDVDARAEALVRRHRQAREDERQAARLDAQRRELEAQRATLVADVERCEQRLVQLVEAARVGDRPALLEAEQRAAAARGLRESLADLDERILAAGEGTDPGLARDETRAVDIDDINARLEEVEVALDELEQQREHAVHELATLEAGRDVQRDADTAAEAASEAEGHLARVRELSQRYLRLRVAALVLRQQIERYRDENQGPILRRAAELFPRLTCGRCRELKVGFGDGEHPVLLCVEADGAEKTVEQLSKGTRDQLYLALRLASLEHHAAHDEPMPLVLDDVLVEFDDPSVQAALEVLGELAGSIQVLLFTHHDHIVEKARLVVPPERLVVHRFDGTWTAGATPVPEPGGGPVVRSPH